MDIVIDFPADLHSIIVCKLQALGYVLDAKDGSDGLFHKLYTLIQRNIPKHAHDVKFSTDILANPKYASHKAVVDEIAAALGNGTGIDPYLSKQAVKLNFKDGMLLFAGIHHAHLKPLSTIGGDGYVERSDDLLFLRIEATTAYLIDIRPHAEQGIFEDQDMLGIVDRNWPELHYAPNMVTGATYTREEIKALRKNNANVIVNAGSRAVMPTMGVLASGAPIEAVMQFDAIQINLENLDKSIRTRLSEYFPGLSGQDKAIIKLREIVGNQAVVEETVSGKVACANF